MALSRWNSIAALALASAGLAGFSAAAEDEIVPAAAEPIEIFALVTEGEEKPVPKEAVIDEQRSLIVVDADEASPYWIGVQLEPPTDILKEHLKLEGGLVTVHVFEGSPAESAGLKANDIILKAADTYIKEPGDLLKVVGKSPEKELSLVLLRAGKETTLKVVPAKRPQPAASQLAKEVQTEEKEAIQKLEAVFDAYKRRSADVESPAVDVFRVRPGVVASRTIEKLELPKDVAVIITKEGGAPARIVVKKEGKEYEATEDKIEKLPEDLRGYVQIVRGGGGNLFAYRALAAPATAAKTKIYRANPTAAPVPAPAYATEAAKVYRYQVEAKHAEGDVDSKLDRILKIVSQQEDSSVAELRKEVQQLRKELEELRKEKK